MKSILVVEDEYAIAELVSVVLEDEGYEVTVARNGREGYNSLGELHPNLVICDVMMPILDGRQLVNAMQANMEYRSIPVVMMSALPEAKPRRSVYVAYLNKPFDPDDLVELVVRIIGPPHE